MDIPRKDMEKLLESLQPSPLSSPTLERLERTLSQTSHLDTSHTAVEKQCEALVPQALSEASIDRLMAVVQHVPFAVDDKVVLFPGSSKTKPRAASRFARFRRYGAAAAVATIGGLAALFSPPVTLAPVVSQLNPSPPAAKIPAAKGNDSVVASNNAGIVATSYGSGIERADDEGIIWTQDRQPCRVLRFQYQDRVLVRDKNGIDRMLLMPREELYVLPEKCD